MKKEKFKSVVVLVTVLLGFLTACQKEDAVSQFLQQTTDELQFTWEGGEKGFAIMTNKGPWSISTDDADWINFDVSSGTGNGKRESILVTVQPNRGDTREGKIRIDVAGEQSEIIVRQEDGRLAFGEAILDVEMFNLGQSIEDTYIVFPYQKGIPGDELTFSVALSGTGTSGINPLVEHSIVLESESGEIHLPITGTPTAVGTVTFTMNLVNNVNGITLPPAISKEVFDPSQPHPDAAAFVISGWLSNPAGSNANHEYIQFLALRDINFAEENFAVITCNNAGQTNGIPPAEGWVTGGIRTYKFNITSGSVSKGQYFYVGGTAGKINGPNSGTNSIPAHQWVKQHDYSALPGDNGVGNTVTNLLANSGLTYGVAVFRGTSVDHDTEPMDVAFLRNPQPDYILFGPVDGANRGFRVTNTDYYAVDDDIKYINQYDVTNTYYNVASIGGAGSTVSNLGVGNFLELRGVYNVVTATWSTPRSRNLIPLTESSTVSQIETENSTQMLP